MILRVSPCDYGGYEVWDSRDPDCPVYLALHLTAENVVKGALSVKGVALVDSVIAARLVARAAEAKRASVDSAIQAELSKRIAAVDYSKPGAEAVVAVFGAAEVKP